MNPSMLNALVGRIGLNLSGFLYHDLSRISDSSTPPSSVSKNIDELFERISSVIGFSQEPTQSKRKRKRKHDSADGDEAEEIQTEEKRSHGDDKAAEKTENVMKSENKKKKRKHKKAKKKQAVLDSAEEEKAEASPYIKRN